MDNDRDGDCMATEHCHVRRLGAKRVWPPSLLALARQAFVFRACDADFWCFTPAWQALEVGANALTGAVGSMVKTGSKVPDATTESAPRGEAAPPLSGVGRFSTDIQTIPNLISLARIVMILATALLYLNDYRATALIIGIFAGISDIVDGWLARKLNQVTELGAILDRLSDLVMETVAFGMLLHYRLVSPTLFIAYMLREYVIGSVRLYVAEKGGSIPSSFLGKRKTNFVMSSFVGLFAAHAGVIEASEMVYKIGYALLIAGLVCSYLSGAIYLRSFTRIYSQSKN